MAECEANARMAVVPRDVVYRMSNKDWRTKGGVERTGEKKKYGPDDDALWRTRWISRLHLYVSIIQ